MWSKIKLYIIYDNKIISKQQNKQLAIHLVVLITISMVRLGLQTTSLPTISDSYSTQPILFHISNAFVLIKFRLDIIYRKEVIRGVWSSLVSSLLYPVFSWLEGYSTFESSG